MKKIEKVIFIEDKGEIQAMIRFEEKLRLPVVYKCTPMSMEEIGDSYVLHEATVGGKINLSGEGIGRVS